MARIDARDIDEDTETFRAYMGEIDDRLRRESVPIPNRPILALRELARDGLQIFSPSLQSKRVFDWFEVRYGQKLAIDFSIGRSLALVRGDPYVVRFPLILGAFDGVFDVTNIFEHFTKELFAALKEDERTALINSFVTQYQDFRYIHLLSPELRSSLDAAVSRVVGTNPHLGESKWASLQFVEKVLKALIQKKGKQPPTIHDLRKLAQLAEGLGGPAVPEFLLRNIQCSAGVRYNEQSISLAQAVGALHAAIKVGRTLAPALTEKEPQTTALCP